MNRDGGEDAAPVAPPPSLPLLFAVFFRMGMASFGGGLPGWMHGEVVERRRWMTEEQFLAGVALGQILPGGNSTNLALYIGQQLRGGPGLIASGVGVLFPPFVIILLMGAAYGTVAGLPGVERVMAGLAAAGVGMTVVIGVKAGRRMRGALPVAVAVAAFLAVGLLRWPMLPVVLALGPVSMAGAWWSERGQARA